jgi:xylose isomerase
MATETEAGAEAPDLTPRPEHKFTFGLWTVGHKGNDPFGEPTRPGLDPSETVRKLADLGAYGVCFHDNDLIPLGTESGERERILSNFRKALDETGMKVSMATTNLFADPVFKDGAFTSNNRDVRRYALQKTLRGIDLGAELGAPIYVFWGGREGVEADAAKPARAALERYREAVDFCCDYVLDRGYDMRFGIEPKPNEPRGDIFLPTVGHALAFIERLGHPEMVGVNPEVAHETMAGLSFLHAVAQALWADKLFHIDLNAQRIGRYDQDFRFGAVGVKDGLFLVKLLEDSGYDGVRHFDARPLRLESEDGIWDFASGCMRTYLALRDRAARMNDDGEIQAALEAAKVPELGVETVGPYSPEAADALLAEQHDLEALRGRECFNERLDQLVVDLLLGLR